jgi:hypothetical protein
MSYQGLISNENQFNEVIFTLLYESGSTASVRVPHDFKNSLRLVGYPISSTFLQCAVQNTFPEDNLKNIIMVETVINDKSLLCAIM